MTIDWNFVVFNMLASKGILARERYETWFKTTVMQQSWLKIDPVVTHRFHHSEFERAFEVMGSGYPGRVILDWK